jgi:hypothetical protein
MTSSWSSVTRISLALCCVLALACATSGRTFNVDSIPKIQRGAWRLADVQREFGRPQGVSVRGSGYTVWRYRSEERSSTDTGTITRIGAFIAGLLGRNVIGSPINVRRSNVTYYQLDVEFNADGFVTDYQYTREDRPSSEVY